MSAGLSPPFVLRGCVVVNPADRGPAARRDVVIGADGSIEALAPPGAPIHRAANVNADSLVAFPGLIDCHVHLCFDHGRHPEDFLVDASDGELRELMRANIAATLARGVTTVRDLASRGDSVRRLKAEIDRGALAGPRIQCAGPALTSVRGHCWYTGDEVEEGDTLERAVEARLAADDEWLKIMITGGTLTRGSDPDLLQFDAADVVAAIARGRRAARPTAVHVLSHDGVEIAVAAGAATIEHGIGLSESQARAMAVAGQALVPTLAAGDLTLQADDEVDAEDLRQVRAQQDDHWRSVRVAVDRGVVVLPGSDAGCPHVPHGSLLAEIERLERAGLDRRAALAGATIEAARVLRLTHVGKIAPGWAADVLLLHANPLEDLSALADPVAVYARGRLVAGGTDG